MMTMLERLEQVAHDAHDYPAHENMGPIVRAILTELREPSDALDDAGLAGYYAVPKYGDDRPMEDGDPSAIFTAMIDAILEGKA
jgi:hypothetical protein